MAEAKKPAPAKPTEPATPAEAPAPAATKATPAAPKKDNTKKVVIIVAAVVGVFIVLPIIAFTILASVIGNKITHNGAIDVDSNSGTVSVKGKDGNEFTAGNNASLPKDFPKDVDVYNDNVKTSSKITENGKTVWSVSVETNDSSAKVGPVLTESFTTDGWTASLNNNSADSGLMIAKKGDMQANIYYATKDGKTTIVYTVAQGVASDSN